MVGIKDTRGDIKKKGKISISWYDFTAAIERQFYPLDYMQKLIKIWQNFRQLKGQNVQGYTQEFRNRSLMLSVDLQSQEKLLQYIGGLHNYLRHCYGPIIFRLIIFNWLWLVL